MRAGVKAPATTYFLQFANAARAKLGIHPLFWPKNQPGRNAAELIEHQDVKAIYTELKHRTFSSIRRWESAYDSSKPESWEIQGLRELIDSCKESVPSIHKYRETHPDITLDSYKNMLFGLYPSKDDVQNIFELFVLRTGWNISTVINIDSENLEDCISPHPTSSKLHLVRSKKGRGNSCQETIGREKSQTSPANLLRTLFAITAPLRATLVAELNMRLASRVFKEDDKLEIAELQRKVRSPWLYLTVNAGNKITCLMENSYDEVAGVRGHLENIIYVVNCKNPKRHIPYMTASDFRDAYISFAYETSGYSWFVAMFAAGHKDVNTLRIYLRKLRWANHSKKMVASYQTAFWKEAVEQRSIDPAFLFALVQRGEITDLQRERWLKAKDRTRIGMGCKTFKNPPKQIAPNHRAGDGCRIHRCTMCSSGVVFDDSMDSIACRFAELDFIKRQMPVHLWLSSSFVEEYDATLATLELFPKRDVDLRVAYWKQMIDEGKHIPFIMEGEYGTK